MKTSPFFYIALVWIFVFGVPAQAQQVDFIKISSSWRGLYDEISIIQKAGKFYRESEEIPQVQVVALWRAINEPIIVKPNLTNLGITQEWLNENAERGLKEYTKNFFDELAPNQQELYRSSLKSPKFIATILPSIFGSWHTHDNPLVEVVLYLSDGREFKLSSESQHLFMLPWEIKISRRTNSTYNAHIAKVIADLMPEDSTNRNRLAGKSLVYKLAEAGYYGLKEKLDLLNVQNRCGKYLSPLGKSYKMVSAKIDTSDDYDYKREPSTEKLHFALKRRNLPKNFSIDVVLPIVYDRIENVAEFIRKIEEHTALIFSTPWLKDHITTHPNSDVRLRYAKDSSFSQIALGFFTREMYSLDKYKLVEQVTSQRTDIALLMVDEAYWLVLPDRKVVLWRFTNHSALRKWKTENLSIRECGAVGHKCIGAVIGPNGTLLSE